MAVLVDLFVIKSFSEIINVPKIKFVEVNSHEKLVKILVLGRLNVILFESIYSKNGHSAS